MQVCSISYCARYVSTFPSITAHCEDSGHQESCSEPRPIQARLLSLAGWLPPSVSDEPYLIIPVFHLVKGSHIIPGYRDISLFPPRRGTRPRSHNDVVDVGLSLDETKIRRLETMKKESNMAVTVFTVNTGPSLSTELTASLLSLKPPRPRALIGNSTVG